MHAPRDLDPEIDESEGVLPLGLPGSGTPTLLDILAGLDASGPAHARRREDDLTGRHAAALTAHRRARVGFVVPSRIRIPRLAATANAVPVAGMAPGPMPPAEALRSPSPAPSSRAPTRRRATRRPARSTSRPAALAERHRGREPGGRLRRHRHHPHRRHRRHGRLRTAREGRPQRAHRGERAPPVARGARLVSSLGKTPLRPRRRLGAGGGDRPPRRPRCGGAGRHGRRQRLARRRAGGVPPVRVPVRRGGEWTVSGVADGRAMIAARTGRVAVVERPPSDGQCVMPFPPRALAGGRAVAAGAR